MDSGEEKQEESASLLNETDGSVPEKKQNMETSKADFNADKEKGVYQETLQHSQCL